MGRLKALPSRLSHGSTRLRSPEPTEAARLHQRTKQRPNWYNTARWQRLRLTALRRDGWKCRQTGVLLVGKYPSPTSAAVDHIIPHHWNDKLFWDLDNLQSVSKEWHDSEKQKLERRGLG